MGQRAHQIVFFGHLAMKKKHKEIEYLPPNPTIFQVTEKLVEITESLVLTYKDDTKNIYKILSEVKKILIAIIICIIGLFLLVFRIELFSLLGWYFHEIGKALPNASADFVLSSLLIAPISFIVGGLFWPFLKKKLYKSN